ncbi:MAG: DnaA regulatory inactivator Hda [Gammaproteobacteria bacterium]|jgi:DnaA family protein|nr:DnaA regulatory inactivator Hda [Gammaproteobacteria bacterium]
MAAQLPLQIALRPAARLDGFVAGSSGEALHAVTAMARGTGERFLFLHGPAGTGKTHLLAGACNLAASHGLRCAFLPLAEAMALSPEALDGLEAFDLVCLDDVDRVASDPAWERALFIFYNALRERPGRLVAAAAVPPSALPLRLPDLSSRLAWGLTLAVQPLVGDALAQALRTAAAARGLDLGAEVAAYLLRRFPRNLPALLALLERLDDASLAAKRPLTVPFVRSILRDGARADP